MGRLSHKIGLLQAIEAQSAEVELLEGAATHHLEQGLNHRVQELMDALRSTMAPLNMEEVALLQGMELRSRTLSVIISPERLDSQALWLLRAQGSLHRHSRVEIVPPTPKAVLPGPAPAASIWREENQYLRRRLKFHRTLASRFRQWLNRDAWQDWHFRLILDHRRGYHYYVDDGASRHPQGIPYQSARELVAAWLH